MKHGATDPRPLIAHIVHRFDVGGLENGLVNVVNGLPEDEFRHTIVALTKASDFRNRVRRADVQIVELKKRAGKDPSAYLRLFRVLRELRPTVLHTRNVGTLDCQVIGSLAGVRVRLHGEHGWDTHDPDGMNRKYLRRRRTMNPLVHGFVCVSKDIEQWLIERVGIPVRKVTRICNGVDIRRFTPSRWPLVDRRWSEAPGGAGDDRRSSEGEGAAVLPWGAGWGDGSDPRKVVVGSVTRFSDIKDPLNLVHAFVLARRGVATAGIDLRLAMIGDGPLWQQSRAALDNQGESGAAWLPGARSDVPALLRVFDVYALGSLREGISNTILEAMASGLPVVASATGGNLELIVGGQTGMLVPPGDTPALAKALIGYALDLSRRSDHGRAARARAESEYSLERMIRDYRQLYLSSCEQIGVAA
jgi:glycosyltransferase involved in cell wall biosynthesis